MFFGAAKATPYASENFAGRSHWREREREEGRRVGSEPSPAPF